MYIAFKCPYCGLRQGDERSTSVCIENWHSGVIVDVGEEESINCPTCKTKLNISLDIQLDY